MTEETIIADDRVATPEQIAASDEMLHLIASALRDIAREPREAFILHAIEGFGIEEIGAITGLSPERVHASISAARAHSERRCLNFNLEPWEQNYEHHPRGNS
jgi:DNA-directed RNA polymerase specialized sigma24 family protein